jgi:hypothetical protein
MQLSSLHLNILKDSGGLYYQGTRPLNNRLIYAEEYFLKLVDDKVDEDKADLKSPFVISDIKQKI